MTSNDDAAFRGHNYRHNGREAKLAAGDTYMRSFRQALSVPPERLIPIGDIVFDNVTMHEAVSRIVEMAHKTDRPRYACTANLDHLALCRQDLEFREVYRRADLVLADGMPVVWMSKPHVMGALHARVAGSDLFWELAKASSDTGLKLFFMGGSPGSAEGAAEEVRFQYPGAKVCGSYCPSFELWDTKAEQERICAVIGEAAPDILLVGLGAPKQEKWIAANRERLRIPVSIGVGGSFEMACGVVRRAPAWMQRSGLEWAYRLFQEPRRLWRRYVGRDVPYLIGMVPTALRQAKYRVRNAVGLLKNPPPKPADEE